MQDYLQVIKVKLPDWHFQVKFTDFVRAGTPNSEPVSGDSEMATSYAPSTLDSPTIENEEDPNVSDASRQNQDGDMEGSDASHPFMVVQVEEAAVSEDQPDDAEALSKVQKLLDTERILKQQAVNKLAEIMARKARRISGNTIWREI